MGVLSRKKMIESYSLLFEILRFIENGYKVKMIKMSNKSLAVDNKEDLAKAKIYLKYKKL